jgi:hypothetical protein
MRRQVEIYVRDSDQSAAMHFHYTGTSRDEFLCALQTGKLKLSSFKIDLELSVLPEWVTDPEQRAAVATSGPIHIRIPIKGFGL